LILSVNLFANSNDWMLDIYRSRYRELIRDCDLDFTFWFCICYSIYLHPVIIRLSSAFYVSYRRHSIQSAQKRIQRSSFHYRLILLDNLSRTKIEHTVRRIFKLIGLTCKPIFDQLFVSWLLVDLISLQSFIVLKSW